MRIPLLLACVLALGAGCSGGEDEAAPGTTTTPTAASETGALETSTARIATAGGEVVFNVEIADSDEERQRGLMFRESLPEDGGMAFLFGSQQTGGFWMKNTLIPLSIAFMNQAGTIMRILDMEPCEADPCEIYDPGVGYVAALEVNQGAFERLGVEEGDQVVID
ncbi:MAG TPA: DUF192 domain-containing protein [Gaiellaceae bacterium]|nr:DUF192 domain-containing protein [Gaiellaceae bacterium]